MPETLLPVIPETITVHLGPPGSNAENVTVNFVDYIKNVASSEVYPTWPENSLRANIYAMVSFALNRVYTKWYRARGYDYDITNSAEFDQGFVPDRAIFENISNIVDESFNDYVARRGSVEPILAGFCDGNTLICGSHYHWKSVELADQGLTPFEILQSYLGNDINIIKDAPMGVTNATYPGIPLRVGDSGNNVQRIQTELNVIAQNYPAIPIIRNVNGVFGADTEATVKKFQEIFNIPGTGTVDEATWYKIKRFYQSIENFFKLINEGVLLDEAILPFATQLTEGMRGTPVRVLQYYLNILSYFNPALKSVIINGVFGSETLDSVKKFQAYYGLPVTGNVNNATWNTIDRVYTETLANLPKGYEGKNAKFYPGYFLSIGMQGENVSDLQKYLNLIGKNIQEIPEIAVTGYFGKQTEDAVKTFQLLFDLPVTGSVGPVTWYQIARQYNFLNNPTQR